MDKNRNRYLLRIYLKILENPNKMIIALIVILLGMGFGMSKIQLDTTVESFLHPENPALVYRNQVKETFGLSDPVVVAVVNPSHPEGVFNPSSLNLVNELTEKIKMIPGVDPEGVTSLATEKNIYGTSEGMRVEDFIKGEIRSLDEAITIKNAVMDIPLYLGNLVSRDGTTTVIIAELLDPKEYGADVYNRIVEVFEELDVADEQLYAAGEGAINQKLAEYVDGDARVLNPISFLVLTVVLIISYRTRRGVFITQLIIIGTVVSSLGLMSFFGVPFFLTSNAIPVILIAIAVQDAIHIFGQYYEEQAKHPQNSALDLTKSAMSEMLKPITITSVTDIVGFLAIAIATTMPPVVALGIWTSVGVAFAWLFSVFLIPALLIKLKPKPSKWFKPSGEGQPLGYQPDKLARLMEKLATVAILKHAKPVLAVGGLLVVLGAVGLSKVQLNDSQIDNFRPNELIYQSDQLLNQKMNGTNFIDIAVKTDVKEGLFDPVHLQKIENLQRYMESLPYVQGSTSIVDFIKLMNRSLQENRQEAYRIPQDQNLIAQYFLLYAASSDPSDFEQYVDYDYQTANVRVALNSGLYQDIKPAVTAAQNYLHQEFNQDSIQGNLAGWVTVFYNWVSGVQRSQLFSVLLSLTMVWLFISLLFRSFTVGVFAVIPVFTALFFLYSIMGFFGIWLNVANSITGAIAIGVSVDFAVHTVEKLISLMNKQGKSMTQAIKILYPTTGRAMFFNFLGVSMGFGVMMFSKVPILANFGLLVITTVAASFIATITVLPAALVVFRPGFLFPDKKIINIKEANAITYENRHNNRTDDPATKRDPIPQRKGNRGQGQFQG